MEYFIPGDLVSNTLITATSKDGTYVSVSGDRDSNGLPTLVKNITVKEKGESAPTELTIKNKKITHAETPNGVIMDLEWQSDTYVVVSLYDPATGSQFNTGIDLTESKSAAALPEPEIQPREGSGQVVLLEEEPGQKDEEMPQTKAGSSSASGFILVDVCGSPAYADPVWMDVYDNVYMEWHSKKGRYYATPVAKGKYSYTVPAGVQDHYEPNISEYTKTLDSMMGYICTMNGITGSMITVCAGLSSAITLFTGFAGTGAAISFLTACTSVQAAITLYCSTLGAGPDGGDSVLTKINDVISKFDVIDIPLYLVPRTSSLNGSVSGKAVMYKTGGTVEEARLSLSGSPSIVNIELSPSSPAAKHSYKATVKMLCMPKGAKLSIEVSGTDDYTQSGSYTFTEDTGEKGIYITVPGGNKGVRDTIVATVTLPDGSVLERTATLKFG